MAEPMAVDQYGAYVTWSVRVHGYTIRARWWGGEYADLFKPGTLDAFDVINMWPASGQQPPFTRESLIKAMRDWRNEITAEELHEYMRA